MPNLGETLTLIHAFKDDDGNLVDPSSIAVSIQLPDLTTVPVTPAQESAGTYSATYTPTLVGRHAITWTPADESVGFADVFNVAPAFSTAMVGLAELKREVRKSITVTKDDELMLGILRSASSTVDDMCGPSVPRTVVEVQDAGRPWEHPGIGLYGRRSLMLATTPILSVTSVEPIAPGYLAPDITDIDVNEESGEITLQADRFFGKLRVTYVAGRAVIPENLQKACLIIAADMYTLYRGGQNATATLGEDDADVEVDGVPLPPKALQLMSRYMREPTV